VSRPIPERSPLADAFAGVLLRTEAAHLLAHEPAPGAALAASGPLTLRYAVEYLGRPHLAIVPGLIALDYGDMLTGEAAWDFLLHRSNLHPRADVIGYRTDGTDDMTLVKLLDLAQPVQVWAYADAAAVKPLARVQALIATPDAVAALPPRLLAYLPRFDSLTDWQTAHEQ
jgi:hypothetical protein